MLVLITATVISCKKNGDLAPNDLTTTLNVINADTNALNVYQNGARLNNTSSLSPGSESGYMSVPFGLKTYQFKIAGATNYIIDGYQLNLDTDATYSLFAAGETADKLFLTTDIAPVFSSTAASTQALIRVVNASPGTTNLTISLRDSLTFTNKAFKYISGFSYIGIGTSTIKVYQAGSTTPIVSGTVTLAAGTYYTLFTKGALTGTGKNQLSAVLLINQ
jgi:hypothetical protein